MPRMKILNSVEREVFDFPPVFNSIERKRCFDFPTPLQDIATSLRTAGNQLVFLLSCGYFKATKRFYPVPTFHRCDLPSWEFRNRRKSFMPLGLPPPAMRRKKSLAPLTGPRSIRRPSRPG